MYLTRLHVDGLRATEMQDLRGPGREAILPDGPVGVAMLDALELFAASCLPARVIPTLRALGVAPPDGEIDLLEEGGLPIQAGWEGGDAAALVGDGRKLTVHVELALDPPLFGRLREEALRDPRLVNGLANGEPTLGIRIGWMFTNDFSTVSIAVLRLAVGEVAFQVAGVERPRWLAGLLHDIGSRIHRVRWQEDASVLAARLHDASLSMEPEVRSRFLACCGALDGPPFRLGRLELVRIGPAVEACFGPKLLRGRQLGPAAVEALRLVEAVELKQPDLLLVECPGARQADPAAVWRWLVSRASGSDAILEQVVATRGGAP